MNIIRASLWSYFTNGKSLHNGITTAQAKIVYDTFILELNK